MARIGGSDRYRGGVELSAGSTHSLIQQAPPEAQPAGLSRPAHTAKGEEVLLAAVWEPEGERRGRRRRVYVLLAAEGEPERGGEEEEAGIKLSGRAKGGRRQGSCPASC